MIYSEAFFSDSDRRHEWIKLRSLLFDGLIKGGRRKKYGTDKRRETNSDGHHRDKHGRRNFKAIENGGTNFKAITSTVRSGGNRSDTDKRGKIYSEGNNRGKTDSKEREKIGIPRANSGKPTLCLRWWETHRTGRPTGTADGRVHLWGDGLMNQMEHADVTSLCDRTAFTSAIQF
mmetsp:Transcript_16106/g.21702  ORF Transcript_16106/g.21702 Transcript_16106/m.21702 type:complete len:175 (+) Transcript_16106:245-769(+)